MEPVGTDTDGHAFDTLLINSTDGAPESDAGSLFLLEDSDDVSSANYKAALQLETQRSGNQMNFYFTIAGSNANGALTIARQSLASLGSSTVKDYNLSTVSSSTDITTQVSDSITSASVTTT